MVNKIMSDKIEHVVVLMLENRSLDSVIGWLYEHDSPECFVPADRKSPYGGLASIDLEDFTNSLIKSDQTVVASSPPMKGASALNVPSVSPHEEFHHINVQFFGHKDPPAKGTKATMKGVLQDYGSLWSESSWKGSKKEILKIMQTYTPQQLPVLNGLGHFYAVSDEWYGSVPTQTNSNRAFSLCGTSMGLVDNGFLADGSVAKKLADDRFKTDTIWNILANNGKNSPKDWGIFWEVTFPPIISSVPYTRRVFPHLEKIDKIEEKFHKMEEFHAMARNGELPAFSYLEPAWTLMMGGVGYEGDDYHPPGNLQLGENLVRAVYDSLTARKEAWEKTLLVITFDEHVGSFDHVSPPWTAKPPWGSGDAPYKLQYEFGFDRFGARVPAMLISPYIKKSTVFRSSKQDVPYDHTSVIATILDWQGIGKSKWGLGDRVLAAPMFDEVLTLSEPRSDLLFDHRPIRGDIMSFGDQFYLRNENGDYIVCGEDGRYFYPCLDNTGAAGLVFRSEDPDISGSIKEDMVVQLRTTEVLAGANTALGAWADRKDCYYYAPDTDPAKQSWRIKRVETGGDGYVRCGDKVFLVNEKYEQHLHRNPPYLTTAAEPQEWSIEPIPDVILTGAVQSGDLLNLRHVPSGSYLVGAESGVYFYPRVEDTGKVTLVIRSSDKELVHGSKVSLSTLEDRVNENQMLGAWFDKHECYYYTPDYNKDKQGWILQKKHGTGTIHYGDELYLVNASYSGQRLVKENLYTTTQRGDPEEPWVLEAVPGTASDDVVHFDDKFYLKHVSAKKRVGNAYKGLQYFPRLLGDKESVMLEAAGGVGELINGTVIRIKSNESGIGKYNILGAWADRHDCYYYTKGYDDQKQSWEIRREAAGGDGRIRFGDEVYLTNLHYQNQRLAQDTGDKKYLTTDPDAKDSWIIERT